MEGQIKIRKPRRGEILCIIEATLGASRLHVRCQDGKSRRCRIPGKLRKRMWMRIGDAVLLKPWDIGGDTNGDAVYRYTATQAAWLRKKGILTME